MRRSVFRSLPLLLLSQLALVPASALLAASEPAEPIAAVEKPEPLPPRGSEVRRPPRWDAARKHGHHRRIGRTQTTPASLSRSKLKTQPYSFVGYVSFLESGSAYQGTGTVVRPRSVLTAAHILWTPGIGWSTNVKFYRARYGSSYQSVASPSRLYIHGNYMLNANVYGDTSAYTFAWDIGWMTFDSNVAGGGYSGYAKRYSALTGTNYCVAVGYGGGTYPKYVEPSEGYYRWGGSAYYLNDSYDHEGGMSGGPVFARIKRQLYETAVIVSSGGGVRAIDGHMFQKISQLP